MKAEGRQADPTYHQVFSDLQKQWSLLKEQEAHHQKNKLFEEKVVNVGSSQIQSNQPNWSENQLYQLQHQIQAYKHLVFNKEVPEQILDRVTLMQPDDWAYRRELIHQNTQKLYEEKFEQNHYLNFHDLWEYITKKLSNEAENLAKVFADSSYIQSYLHHLNEVDEISAVSKELEDIIKDEHTPPDEKEKAELTLKMIQIRPLQKQIREEVLSRYLQNKVALNAYKQQTLGDTLFEKQLVDREFYKRAKIYQSSKKEARTLDRFEQQMRSGQELRKKTRHKEFLNEILIHAKEFTEFHKKRQNFIRKKAQIVKGSLDYKEKKEQQMRDKEEKDRIKALKENNIGAYIDLISSQKNSRLLQILEQTHKYLEQLGAKVNNQKNENLTQKKKADQKGSLTGGEEINGSKAEEAKDENELQLGEERQDQSPVNEFDDDEIPDAEKIKHNLKSGSKVYYSITHTISEEIKEQPKLLKGGDLKSYQMTGLNWMVSLYNNNLNGILADEMGLGKTIQTISLFCYLIESKGCEGPFLVVVPLTTISNWSMEFDKWAPDVRKIIYKGKKHERPLLAQHLKNDKFHVVLTTYEYILNDKATLSKIAWQYIIVDEGHRMKNSKSKFALTLGQQYQSAHRILLTGTPLQNNLSELWALLNFLLPKIFASCEEFQKWFDKPLTKIHPATNSKFSINEKQAFELSEEEQLLIINRLHQVLRPFLLRRVKSEVETELPDKIEKVIKVDLSAWQKIVYKGIQDNGSLARDPSTGKVGNVALRNTVMQLRKICNHPYLFLDYLEPDDMRDNIYRSSGKFELLDRILPKLIKTNHKVLLFSQFTQVMDVLQIFFEFRGIKHLRLDGGTKYEDRKLNLELFNKGQFQVFLLSTRAGGHGLNLQVADTVIIFDSDWNPQMDEQAKDRAHRIGQKHEVRVYRLITTTKIEEGILSKATMKKDLDAKIIQAGMFNDKASDNERQRRLEDLIRKEYEEDEEQEENEIPNDEQVNLLLKRNDKELELFTKMDQERYLEEDKEGRLAEIIEKMEKGKAYNVNHINYRLLQEWEVPEWIKEKPVDPNKPVEEYGVGKRQRNKVNYNDEMSEGQWLKIIESGGDINQELEKRRQRKFDQQQSSITDVIDDVGAHMLQEPGKYLLAPEEGAEEEYGDEVEDRNKVHVSVDQDQGVKISIQKNLDPELFHQFPPAHQQVEEGEVSHEESSGKSKNKRKQKMARKASQKSKGNEDSKMGNESGEEEGSSVSTNKVLGKRQRQSVFCGIITNNDESDSAGVGNSVGQVSGGATSTQSGRTKRKAAPTDLKEKTEQF